MDIAMCLEDSNERCVSLEMRLQTQNMGPSNSKEGMHDKYSQIIRYLLLKSLEESSYGDSPPLDDLEGIEIFGIHFVINMLALRLFNKEFENILERRYQKDPYCETEDVQFFLSRCVLLCPVPTYFNFVLVVAFLTKVVIVDVDDLDCFDIMYMSEFCLDVLYRRIFWKIFQSEEDFEKLNIFCDEFRKKFALTFSTIIELRSTPLCENWINLIQNCLNAPDVGFPLEESEITMFRNASWERNNLEYNQRMAWNIEKTFFSGVRKRQMQSSCQLCGTKCHNYLTYLNSFISI
ncbi:hypothetical protein TNIN_118551 [Trichonephila inaurata madagascariensis]|uniref:Uncharacterized protein n=1 Tax=Trichonephila inaurata madagascariensis TaxID=2747483 RepID=A0A8X7CDM5_9ARAC|nr:hypothetical protein TNIN_118551 [Trichonephila inaurata madagascariensis]